jgi:hypothetical protein
MASLPLVILRSVKVNRRETLRDLTNIVNERLPRPVSTRTVSLLRGDHPSNQHIQVAKFRQPFSKHALACHDQQLLVFHLRILHVSNIIELTWQAYLCTNYAHRKIAEIIGRDHSTITKFLRCYDERNSVENKPKTGRRKLVTERGGFLIAAILVKYLWPPTVQYTYIVGKYIIYLYEL